MPTDQLIDAKLILHALAEIKRRGIWPMLQDLEHTEPELASFIFEEVSLLHSRLFNAGVKPKQIQILQRQVQKLVVVTLTATVAAHRQLWELPKPVSPSADDRPLPISD